MLSTPLEGNLIVGSSRPINKTCTAFMCTYYLYKIRGIESVVTTGNPFDGNPRSEYFLTPSMFEYTQYFSRKIPLTYLYLRT